MKIAGLESLSGEKLRNTEWGRKRKVGQAVPVSFSSKVPKSFIGPHFDLSTYL